MGEFVYYGTAISLIIVYQGGMVFPALFWHEKKDGDPVEAYKEFYREAIKPELMTTLEETRRVLRPGGKFIIHPLPAIWIMDVEAEIKERGYRVAVQDVPPIVKRLSPEMQGADMEYMKRVVLTMPE